MAKRVLAWGYPFVKHLVEHHNGRLGVESELGRGATFFFTLPRKTAADKTVTE